MKMVECGGKVEGLDYEIPFLFDDLTRLKKIGSKDRELIALVFYPEEFYWIPALVHAVMLACYQGNTVIRYTFMVTSNKKDMDMVGIAMPTHNEIIIAITPKISGVLKRCKPEKCATENVISLLELIWHEIQHFKRKNSRKEITDDIVRDVLDDFFGIYDEMEGDENG